MSVGTIRYWASARAAAGTDEEQVEAATLAEALAAVRAREPARPRLAEILRICSYVVDTRPVGTRPPESVALEGAWVVEALPPFAGG